MIGKRCEVSGPRGTATVATVRDTPRTAPRHIVTVRTGHSVIPVATFVASQGRTRYIGASPVQQGGYADAVRYAKRLMRLPLEEA